MLFGFVLFLFMLVCILLVLFILIQKGSSSMGLGNLGGSNLMLFGGSGGQDVLQKITWVLGFIFMAGSLTLAILKTKQVHSSRYLNKYNSVRQNQA
jgi:protein translocase SecG subunit